MIVGLGGGGHYEALLGIARAADIDDQWICRREPRCTRRENMSVREGNG